MIRNPKPFEWKFIREKLGKWLQWVMLHLAVKAAPAEG
jgi:hypothetical protein